MFHTVSGRKPRDKDKQIISLFEELEDEEFGVILVWKLLVNG